MTFLDMLAAAEHQNHSMLCVGLDPEPARFPAYCQGDATALLALADAQLYLAKASGRGCVRGQQLA